MREILFRGKRTDNGKWVEGCLDFNQDKSLVFIRTPHIIYTDVNMVPLSTVGQYTGLKDKNGKRIFEGDIVCICFVDTDEIGEIVWDEEWSKTAYLSQDGDKYGIDGTVEMEVIGNIHDNPELMEVRDGMDKRK